MDSVLPRNPAFEILGTQEQALQFVLYQGQSIMTHKSFLIYTSSSVNCKDRASWKVWQKQDFFSAKLSNSEGEPAFCCLTSNLGGKILAIDTELYSEVLIIKKNILLASTSGISIIPPPSHHRSFIRNSYKAITGKGLIFIQTPGFLIEKKLGEGEEINVHMNAIHVFTSGAQFSRVNMHRSIYKSLRSSISPISVKGPGSVLIDPVGDFKFSKPQANKRSPFLVLMVGFLPIFLLVLLELLLLEDNI